MLRITELTNMLDASNGKVNSLNKAKDKLTSEIKELTIEIDNLGGENCSFNFVGIINCNTEFCVLWSGGATNFYNR